MCQTDTTPRLASALIVDDHPLFCDALAMTLRAVADIRQVDTTATLGDALTRLRAGRPDVIVLDLNLPDVSGMDGLLRLAGIAGNTPIVVVSSMTEPRVISAAMRAGARGFVPKHSGRDVFRRAFEQVAAGATYLPDGYVEITEDTPTARSHDDALSRLSTLTKQQARILQLICEGKLNKQIAFDLSIAETTVKAHVTAIMRKLGVQSRTQAVLIASEARFANLLQNGPEAP